MLTSLLVYGFAFTLLLVTLYSWKVFSMAFQG